jgi:putative hydrolase of the HAD superfamily
MNIKLGLISNCAPEEVVGWPQSPLADLFDDIIFSFEVKYAKPNPEIYLTACENLMVSPKDSIFIGDGGSNELQGAADVGMNPYHATWFQTTSISEKISGFPKLHNPMDVLILVEN